MPGSVDEALALHGHDGAWLLRTAYAVSNVYCRKTGASLGDRIDDMAQHLAVVGCRYAVKWDPAKVRPGYSFESWVWDIMERRATDFFRRRAEGFGDRRYGQDNRVHLAGDLRNLEPSDAYLQLGRTFGEGVAGLAETRRLSPDAVWALREVAGRIALGFPESLAVRHAAKAAGFRVTEAQARLELLRDELTAEHAQAA